MGWVRLKDMAGAAHRGLIAGLACVTMAACGEEVIPPSDDGDPQLTRLTAPTAPDSVDAAVAVNYSLAVRRPSGSGVEGASVVFEATNALVGAVGGTLSSSAALTTGSDGSVAAAIALGTSVGSASVVASVPALGLADTLALEVLAGAPDSTALTVSDTTVLVGSSFTASATGVDRYGNAVSVTPTIVSGPLSVVDSVFTADHFGTAVLVAGMGTVPDSAVVRAVPDGALVYTDGSMARLIRFDGTEAQTLGLSVPNVREPSIDWSRDGNRVVVGGLDGFRVFDLLNGQTLPTTWPGGIAGSGSVIWPRFGPAGNRIHYSAATGGEWDLRAADLDASNASITIGAGVNSGNDLFPDWAPDSSAFVFTADWETRNAFFLRLSNADASTVTTLTSAEAVTPKFSPDGGLIAWQELGQVGVVSPDETILRSWNPGWSKGVTWSPDGTTLVGLRNGTIAIIDVVSGDTMEFPELAADADAVAWRPEPMLVPTTEPTIQRWSAPTPSDSVDSEVEPEYSVIVRDTDGAPWSGATVDFSGTNAVVAPSGETTFGSTVQVVTDSNGFASARIRLGTMAGSAHVVASIDSMSVADTVFATVIPGAPVGDSLRFPLPDTTVLVGDTIDVSSAQGFDRYGNPTTLSVSVASGPLSGTGPFVADRFGNAQLVASVGALADTAFVRIVPPGEFVAVDGSTAAVMSFDGSTVDTLSFSVPSAQERSIDWSPDGTKIVVGSFSGFRVFDLGPETVTPSAWPGGTAGAGSVIWPRFGPSGNRIYYSAQAGGDWDLREADADASNAAITIAAGVNSGNDLFPDWAPDSSAFVFTADWETTNAFFLRVSNPDASVVTTLTSAEGVTPKWSPDSGLIAWQELGMVGVVSPDETVSTSWNPGWSKGVTWSPDGTTLVGLNSGVIEILDVATGETMDFPEFGNSFEAVAWRPN